ncbi:unnamed protein product [Vicia faba]|uniref:Uncharacterized protein n=1 Tax=Vicia faba TaxID=3906 RepID=A0AAV1A2F3_VICFA|nr:unnamed protein product [Vicia faba]
MLFSNITPSKPLQHLSISSSSSSHQTTDQIPQTSFSDRQAEHRRFFFFSHHISAHRLRLTSDFKLTPKGDEERNIAYLPEEYEKFRIGDQVKVEGDDLWFKTEWRWIVQRRSRNDGGEREVERFQMKIGKGLCFKLA